jgi:hypothetical protein
MPTAPCLCQWDAHFGQKRTSKGKVPTTRHAYRQAYPEADVYPAPGEELAKCAACRAHHTTAAFVRAVSIVRGIG